MKDINKKALLIALASALISSCSSQNNLITDINSINNQAAISSEKNFLSLAPRGWGSPSQVAATYAEYLDINGNNDGIWENEDSRAGTVKGIGVTVPLKPWFDKKVSFLKGASEMKEYIQTLSDYLNKQERKNGTKITKLNASDIENIELFSVQKAIYLERFKRKASEVTEGFIRASGSINNYKINDRDIFWQRFKPLKSPNGKVVVISPGFQESGRNFYEQINKMNKLGYDVIAMDHQWAGYSKGGEAGGLDRGFGVARDVAAVAAFAENIRKLSYSSVKGSETILFGNSMGGGPGVIGALTLNDNNKLKLNGDQMPKGMKAILQAPYLESSSGLINTALGVFSHLPFANKLKLYSSGIPVLTHSEEAAQKGTQVILLEDIRAQLKTMSAANKDIKYVLDLIQSGNGPKGELSIVHGKNDPLASSEKSVWLKKVLGNQVKLNIINSNNHVLEQNPDEQDFAIDSLRNSGI